MEHRDTVYFKNIPNISLMQTILLMRRNRGQSWFIFKVNGVGTIVQ